MSRQMSRQVWPQAAAAGVLPLMTAMGPSALLRIIVPSVRGACTSSLRAATGGPGYNDQPFATSQCWPPALGLRRKRLCRPLQLTVTATTPLLLRRPQLTAMVMTPHLPIRCWPASESTLASFSCWASW